MSQRPDPRRYDRQAVELSRIQDPQALAQAILAAAREPQASAPSEPPPTPGEGERGWIEA